MKRKMVSILLVMLLCFGTVISVSASPYTNFVVDEFGYLAESEIASLNQLAGQIYEERNVGIFYVYTKADSLTDYDISTVVGDIENYYVMMENETSWYSFAGGTGESIDVETEEMLRGIYDETETYVDGVEAFILAAAELFPYAADTPERDPQEIEEYTLLDDADLLNDQEEAELTEKLQNISQKYNAQLVISTLPSMEGGDIDEFVEFLYDTLGFGYGENHDGVLLLVSMEPREYRILANGYAAKAIDEDTGNAIGDAFSSELTSGNYAKAFGIFADKCQYYLDGHLNGFPFNLGKNLVTALVIGIVIGLIVAFVLKGQLKSVRKKEEANVYVKPGSMQLTTSNDFFLYRTISRRKKESSSSNSSGPSRSVSGGSF